MNADDLRQRLLECDRYILELQYELTKTLEYKQVLLKHHAALSSHEQPGSEIDARLRGLEKEITRASTTLERLRSNIASCSDLRASMERSCPSDIDG
ncbi:MULTISPECIES: hypothetical protein [unclassified Leptolyngbya]|uniref:hypothetical protein n=1 Tax=unclassified Leptolyngbya TaxID=2650499 RepID=UPI0016844ADE|nr:MULTISPECIES: hypothetical protein [unclassified Leptolyngbya]MBD1912863.1 hypothetical protein [Leptolyngbya sp. FACHB-8]MBD2157474.1 hypothetical protein [Leptolyngbya sp. FACHB-16]